MRIEKIILNNFGSYEGKNSFDTHCDGQKNIVLVGGKNGAGKTTLFTAIRLCLYGYVCMGYKSHNAYYSRAIVKLINNSAKLSRPTQSSVSVVLSLSNGHELDCYVLTRSWVLEDSVTEKFSVKKNDEELTEEEVGDFEKYLYSLIPPELFNLYFFDGEKIADFFLEEGSNARIKEAFLTLCGYDTFEIMRKNFKRTHSEGKQSQSSLQEYLDAKEKSEAEQQELIRVGTELKICQDTIFECSSAIELLEKQYRQAGGVTEEEWSQKLVVLKEEEKKREGYNILLKKWANDIIPFIILREQLEKVEGQITRENNSLLFKSFCEIISNPEISSEIPNTQSVVETARRIYGDLEQPILDLSFEQSAVLMAQIKELLLFAPEKVVKIKKAIKRSIALSAKTRAELDDSSISSVREYMQQRATLFENKSELLERQVELEKAFQEQAETAARAQSILAQAQNKLESELKRQSINDISTRAIVMLDDLQKRLYKQQIEKMEGFFKKSIKLLMRKKHFIDDIHIDDDFTVKIYKNEEFTVERLSKIFTDNNENAILALLGKYAVDVLCEKLGCNDYADVGTAISCTKVGSFVLPIEIEKTSLSNGEKQIFIMALYHSLIQLCNHEVPFIIDTPFARIDTEHRVNISKHFFSRLNGQVFILSTNEEIDSKHVGLLSEHIASTFMLDNIDNTKTTVAQNMYFEV